MGSTRSRYVLIQDQPEVYDFTNNRLIIGGGVSEYAYVSRLDSLME